MAAPGPLKGGYAAGHLSPQGQDRKSRQSVSRQANTRHPQCVSGFLQRFRLAEGKLSRHATAENDRLTCRAHFCTSGSALSRRARCTANRRHQPAIGYEDPACFSACRFIYSPESSKRSLLSFLKVSAKRRI